MKEVCAIVTLRSDLIPGLSVQQTVNFAAALTVSRVLSAKQRHERVKRVVEDMGLNDPQLLNKEVSLLTTSEKRRLIIAMELVRDPCMPYSNRLIDVIILKSIIFLRSTKTYY